MCFYYDSSTKLTTLDTTLNNHLSYLHTIYDGSIIRFIAKTKFVIKMFNAIDRIEVRVILKIKHDHLFQ